MSSPSVSIVVPCYNVETYLPQVLDSILAQTLEDIEVICVNDGSTDSTPQIIRSYMERDERVHIVDGPNGGYGKAMNRGMAAAGGEYIGIVESDDYIEPGMYAALYAAASENDADFVRSDFYKFWTNEDGSEFTVTERLTPKEEYYNTVVDPWLTPDIFNAQMLNWTGVYKRSFLEANRICHNESPGASYQDNGFWFLTYCYARRVVLLPQAFYHYRQDNMASSINQSDKVFAMLDEYAWIRKQIDERPELQPFLGLYHYKKTHNLNFAFNLLADEYQTPFLERYSAEYRAARDAGELDEGLFWPEEWEQLQQIVDDPHGYLEDFNRHHRESKADERARLEAREKGVAAQFAYSVKYDGLGTAIGKAFRKLSR